MADVTKFKKRENIGVISVNSPPVNALSAGVRQGISDAVATALCDESVEALVLICEGRTFIAGADISEFGKEPTSPQFSDVLEVIDNSEKPIIAAIHGTALGGGLETALACHYRIAMASSRFGLPEVNLGLIPGGGGTQRLPRVVGVEQAIHMISTGSYIGSDEALSYGLIDAIVLDDLLTEAIEYAQMLASDNAPVKRIRDLNGKIQHIDSDIFSLARKKMSKQKHNFIAPQHCIDAVEIACKLPFQAGLEKEREIFNELKSSDQSSALRHQFFAERIAAKVEGLPKHTHVLEVGKAAVIGTGTMGGGIAMNLVNSGIPTVIYEQNQAALDRGVEQCRDNYNRTVKRGRLSQAEMDKRMALISTSLDMQDMSDVDIVIEAAFEDMAVKKDIFSKLDGICKQGAILASNTSTLDVDEIANSTTRPGAVIGLHFFSPANVMKLLEIVRGKYTDAVTLASCLALANKMEKVPVVVGVCDGFVGNRMLHKYVPEAAFLLEEGLLPHEVDNALYDWGMAMGPCSMNDFAGLDIGWRVRKGRGIPPADGSRYSYIADKICELGRYGQKTGAGFYDYDKSTRQKTRNSQIEALIVNESRLRCIERRDISNEEIVERTIFALVNEGAKILTEGIAQRASDIDVIYVNGYGFPAYRGGPMFYANSLGLRYVYDRICEFHQLAQRSNTNDMRWKPAPLIKSLAVSGGTFS